MTNHRLGSAISLGLLVTAFPVALVHAAMHTPGKFGVGAVGSATYSIPIQVPPGSVGMTPNLSIEYDSHGGNGLVGKGGSVSGLPSIERCPRSTAQDGVTAGGINYDANDRYCLNGQRLVVTNGGVYGADATEYRTEQEGFSKIVSYGTAGNGPAWFKVWTKSGRIMEFGNTADSRIEAQGRAAIRVWAINRVQDRKTNYLTVSYVESADSTEFYPSRIDYSGNVNAATLPSNSVRFVYQGRPDVMQRYLAGSLSRTSYRLSNLQTYTGTALTLDYRLSYENVGTPGWSRLTSIRQCDAAGICLAPTSFSWTDSGAISLTVGTRQGSTAPSGETNAADPIALDFSGDGKTDLVYQRNELGTLWLLPAVANGAGFTLGSWVNTGQPYDSAGLDGFGPNLIAADLNGDSKVDLVHYWIHTTTESRLKLMPMLSNGTGFTLGTWYDTAQAPGTFESGHPFMLSLDINGDGRADLVQQKNIGGNLWLMSILSTGTSFSAGPWTSTGQPFATVGRDDPRFPYYGPGLLAMDLNGDNKADLVQRWDNNGTLYLLPHYSVGTTFAAGSWYNATTPYTLNVVSLDINGDGLLDLAASPVTTGTTDSVAIVPLLSTGVGFSKLSGVSPNQAFPVPSGTKAGELIPMDINGDGKVDLMQGWESQNTLLLQPIISYGTGVLPTNWSNTGQPYYSTYGISPTGPRLLAMDINGDGKMDLAQQWNGEAQERQIQPLMTNGTMGDLLRSVSNGLGASVTINYTPLTDPSVYTKDTGGNAASYPLADLQLPIYTMTSSSSADGTRGAVTTHYTFGGLKMDWSRRQMAGFRWAQTRVAETGITHRTVYRQDWPFVGMTSLQEKTLPGSGNAGMLAQVTNSFGCTNFVHTSGCAVAPGQRYFAFVSQRIESRWDLNGAALPTMTTTTQYDGNASGTWSNLNAIFGNPTQVLTSASDGYSSRVVNTYTNDVANWSLGRLDSTTTTNTTP
jgi:hypothetical protein